ncbi:3-oxoadipate enol-lactonase [Saccharomonospora cyanea]|uniref:3-oxoadipate enol-lactonase n=1 Tax=Saccharomonospora cyanea NA-134 TaxID=882082 RepID=H5XHA2_9PSEU|nr:3-oxoadipate enol-lactonase [Saccharomonospora cyanea]EHR60587.1 3-oxoadipate enol-lactonase [Saccharomonospora cyanea NA-134]
MKLHHQITGPDTGEVVVLAGSIGSNLSMWDPQVPRLVDAGFRVVRFDNRGHGRTPVPDGPSSLADLGGDVVELLDTLEVERAHLVGLSLGGMIGMWLGAHRPSRIDRLVLCCTSAKLGTPQTWRERATQATTKGMVSIADGSITRWFTPGWIQANPGLAKEFHHMTATVPARGYASCCAAIGGMDLRDALPSITAPTLVVAGADDPATPPEHARLIAERIPDARLEIVDDAAHLGNVEQPETFGDLITKHLTAR